MLSNIGRKVEKFFVDKIMKYYIVEYITSLFCEKYNVDCLEDNSWCIISAYEVLEGGLVK